VMTQTKGIYPGPLGLGLSVRLTTSPHKNIFVGKLLKLDSFYLNRKAFDM
jgi:hypothetical protein